MYYPSRNFEIAKDEILKTLIKKRVPISLYPSRIGVIRGRTSKYYHKYPHLSESERNPDGGAIDMSSVLLEEYPEEDIRKVARHETGHLIQELIVGRDMDDDVVSKELEAEAFARDPDNFTFGNRMTPILNYLAIAADKASASSCFVINPFGIPIASAHECSTYELTEKDNRLWLRILSSIF